MIPRIPTLSLVTAPAAALLMFPGTMLAAGSGTAAPPPDFTRGDNLPEKATHDWNLGPTGARGWIYSRQLETSEARQVYVTRVEAGSPADGVLETDDVLPDVAGQPFSHDPRTELGKAITAAEAGDGSLGLLRWRDGKTETVAVRIDALGIYAPGAPFQCEKSKRLLERGCEALAKRMREKPEEGHRITQSLNALALLASGNPTYLPLSRNR